MSDRPIQSGDLVQIVRPRPVCGCGGDIGLIFKVTEIRVGTRVRTCGECGLRTVKVGELVAEGIDRGRGLQRLKRIPPLSELEGQRTQEDIKEPA